MLITIKNLKSKVVLLINSDLSGVIQALLTEKKLVING